MNLFNCQGLSLTAVSPPAATLAPWAHEMCPVLDGVLGKQTLKWLGVAWNFIRTYPCRKMRKTVWSKRESWPISWCLSLSHPMGGSTAEKALQSCLKLSHRSQVLVSSHQPSLDTGCFLRASPWIIQIPVAETISSEGLSQYSQFLREEHFDPDKGIWMQHSSLYSPQIPQWLWHRHPWNNLYLLISWLTSQAWPHFYSGPGYLRGKPQLLGTFIYSLNYSLNTANHMLRISPLF